MSVAFWSVAVKSGEKLEVQPPEGYVLNVQQVALAGEGSGKVSLKVETESIEGEPIDAVLCSLKGNAVEQVSLALVFGYDVPVKLYTTGDAKYVLHVSGYYQPAPEDFDEDDDDEEDDDEDDDDEGLVTKAETLKALAAAGGEDDEEDDDDDEEEDDAETAAFIKKMIAKNASAGAGKKGGDDEEDDDEDDEDDEDEEDDEDDEEEDDAPPAKMQKTPQGAKPTQQKPQQNQKPGTPGQQKPGTPGQQKPGTPGQGQQKHKSPAPHSGGKPQGNNTPKGGPHSGGKPQGSGGKFQHKGGKR